MKNDQEHEHEHCLIFYFIGRNWIKTIHDRDLIQGSHFLVLMVK